MAIRCPRAGRKADAQKADTQAECGGKSFHVIQPGEALA
jgi:hypothetical protein